MGKRRRKKRSKSKVPASDGDTPSLPPLTTTEEEMEDVSSGALLHHQKETDLSPSTGIDTSNLESEAVAACDSPQTLKNELSKAGVQLSDATSKDVKGPDITNSAQVTMTSHSTAESSKAGAQLPDTTSGEMKEAEITHSKQVTMMSHSKAESSRAGGQMSERTSTEENETETAKSGDCTANEGANITSHSTAGNGFSSKRREFQIKPFRRMVRRLEALLSHKEVIEMAQLTEQSPDFILRISELDTPLHLLMANLEKQGIVTEDNFEVLIDILDEIEATDALDMVETFTARTTPKGGQTDNGEVSRKEPEQSLNTATCGQESFQHGDKRQVRKKQPSTSRDISKSTPRGRAIACSWKDFEPSLVLESFGIRDQDGQRLSIADSILLNRIHLHECVLTPKNVLLAFLNRLMSYDYRSMRLFKELDSSEFREIGKPSRSKAGSNVKSVPQKLSCRDFTHAIIRNCDPFLQQEVLSKLSACQLAVPILLPDTSHGKVTLLLWGLQRVSKAWQDPKTSQVLERAVVNFPFPVVAALRFGNVPFSKSNILNKMLGSSQGNDDHPYFFSREQDSRRSLLSKGTLEAVWYLPSGGKKGKRHLSEALCFINLRGDANEFTTQQSFACGYSLITIVFINKREMHAKYNKMTDLSKKSRLIVVMGSSDESISLQEEKIDDAESVIVRNKKMSIFDASQMNTLDLSEKLCVEINRNLGGEPRNISDNIRSLGDTLSICEEHRIAVDIHDEECTQAKLGAERVLHSCKQGPKAYKSHALPLQLNWQEWSRLDKDRSWKGAQGDVERELAKLHKAKEDQRRKQRETSSSREIQELFKELSNPSSTYKQFLVFWLQHFLNETSFESLRPLVDKLKALRDEMRETAAKITHLQRSVGDDDTISPKQRQSVQRQVKELTAKEARLQSDLLKHTEEFDASSLGFEHFVREFGQIYECFHNTSSRNEVPFDIKSLPKMAAEMLLSGQPLEIFDGDACHVPIKWVTGVLAAVRDMVGEASVYVISVIGIQSSGKSTLLNSMFGVRFAVSAGRCTRGVFLQMLPVSEDLKRELGCDFVAVIDTEGLKAPEKAIADRKNEDNELATFALCLSDMTLINIGGQTVGEDLSNILQISAHAFIRMKEVHLRSSCYLIQQFVADITAQYRNQSSTQSILQKLDQAVVTAAIEERKQDQYRQFSDCFNIVNIDNKSRYVQYIPSLWRSAMSAPNHEYSETVLRLKSSLLEEVKGETRKQKIWEFANRIDNVWNAIKQEDFVFNFCNTNEISQYNNFTRFYKKQQLNLTQEMMKWELEAKQKIKNTTSDNVSDRRTMLFQELDEKLANMVNCIKTSLEEELKNKEYESVRQHSTFFFRDLELVQTQTRETVRNMLKLESSIILNATAKENQLLPRLIGDLRRKVLTVAERIKQDMSQHNEDNSSLETTPQAEEEMRTNFEEEWTKQMTSVDLEYPTTSENDIKRRIETDITMCIMETLQNTSLSKDMKELLNSHKLPAFCHGSPVVKTTEDIDKASLLIGSCSREITHHIENIQRTVEEKCLDEKFTFSAEFVNEVKDLIESVVLQPCEGCRDKTELLLCLSSTILQFAHSTTKCNVLNRIMKSKQLLEKLGRRDISDEEKIKREVTQQLKEFKHKIGSGYLKKFTKFFVDFLPSWQSHDWIDENFYNLLRNNFNSCIARVDANRWYSLEMVKTFIEMAHHLTIGYRIDDQRRQQLLGNACSFFMQEACQSERKALARDLSWPAVQVILKCEAIEIIDQVDIFVDVLKDVLPNTVCNTLIEFSETMVDKLSRITLTEDRRHSLDEYFIFKVPLLGREKYDTILSEIHDSRQLFLAQIKSSGVYNTNLIRALVTSLDNDLTRNRDIGREAHPLIIAHVCSWALPICIGIELTFQRENSVQTQLEKEKERLFLDFKSLCEGACQDKLAAKSVCTIIEESLQDSLKTKICSALFERLSKAGDEIFYSRTRFLQVVLENLCLEEDFNNYTKFLRQHTSFIQDWTLNFIATQCCDDSDSFVSIKDIALYEIDQLIRSTEESLDATLRDVNDKTESETNYFETWANSFSQIFESRSHSSLNEEKISLLSLHSVLTDCELFTNECKMIMSSSTKDTLLNCLKLPDTSSLTVIKEWFNGLPKQLHVLLAESVRGCGSQCPFCKTFCDDTVKKHNVHMSNLHFPVGIGGVRFRFTHKLACDTCTANVASDREYYNCGCPELSCVHPSKPFREYRQDYPDWDIKPISDYEATLYWKWVLTRFNDEFARYYNCKTADIPWGSVTKAEALESVRNVSS